MKQSGHLNPSEETGTGCPVTSKYGRTPPSKQGRHQQQLCSHCLSGRSITNTIQHNINIIQIQG